MDTTHLDHKSSKPQEMRQMVKSIQDLSKYCDQIHYLQRKIQFFLDIRGYLKLNKLTGNYVEFGCFRGEMMYGAYHILDSTETIKRYYGLDTFSGEPQATPSDDLNLPGVNAEEFSCEYESVLEFVDTYMGGKADLIAGDFRESDKLEQIQECGPFNVIVIDCNLLSSIRSSLEIGLNLARHGAVLFIDDYLTNLGNGRLSVKETVDSISEKLGKELMPFQFYPPFSRSFIVY